MQNTGYEQIHEKMVVRRWLFISKKQDKRVKVNVVRRIEHNGSDTSVI